LLEGEVILPASELNRLRRDLVSQLEALRDNQALERYGLAMSGRWIKHCNGAPGGRRKRN